MKKLAALEQEQVQKKYYADSQPITVSTHTAADSIPSSQPKSSISIGATSFVRGELRRPLYAFLILCHRLRILCRLSSVGRFARTGSPTSSSKAHVLPPSSFDAKTQGLPQEFANPEQYRKDHHITDSGVSLPTSADRDADPFSAENDVGAGFVGGAFSRWSRAECSVCFGEGEWWRWRV